MKPGTLIRYRIRWRFVSLRWLTEITEWQPPTRFVDVQRQGPYKLWHHTHTFEPERNGTLPTRSNTPCRWESSAPPPTPSRSAAIWPQFSTTANRKSPNCLATRLEQHDGLPSDGELGIVVCTMLSHRLILGTLFHRHARRPVLARLECRLAGDRAVPLAVVLTLVAANELLAMLPPPRPQPDRAGNLRRPRLAHRVSRRRTRESRVHIRHRCQRPPRMS